jgi:hypothetical protein
MQLASTIEGEDASKAIYLEAADEAAPPIIGEKISAQGSVRGIYKVKEREFIANFPDKHFGNFTYGWAFVHGE